LIFKNSDQYVALTEYELIENPNEIMVFNLVQNENVEFFDKKLKT